MAGRVEFVDADPGPHDAAPTPRPHRTPPSRRRTVVILVAAAAVVLGLLVARAASTDKTPTAAPSPAGARPVPGVLQAVLDTSNGETVASYCPGDPDLPGSIEPSRTPTPRLIPTGGRLDRPTVPCPQDATYCPPTDTGQPTCAFVGSVPSGVLRVVRRQYPGATLAAATTEITRTHGLLWYRLLVFSIGRGSTLRVDVIQRRTTLPGSGEREDASGLVARALHVHGSLATVVTLGRPGGSTTDFTTLSRLAADTGLTAIG